MRAIWIVPIIASILILGLIGYGSIVFGDDDDDDDIRSLLCPVGQVMTGILFEDDDEILDVICDNVDTGGEQLDAILAALSVVPELCDDVDNNVNGKIDETFEDKGKSCFSTGLGICKTEGVLICNSSGDGTVCSASDGTPETEICEDGLDNNCNGLTDETEDVHFDCIVTSDPKGGFLIKFCGTIDPKTDIGAECTESTTTPNAPSCPLKIEACVPPSPTSP